MQSGTARRVYALAAGVGVAALGAGLAFGTHLMGANSTSSAQLLSGAPNGITRAVAGNVQRLGKPTPKKAIPRGVIDTNAGYAQLIHRGQWYRW